MKKSTIVKIAVVAAVVLIGGFVLVRVLQAQVSEQFGGEDENEVQAAEVTVGSIRTTVSGSGTLTNEDSEDTFITDTVDVTEVYVDAGDVVKKGDMLASVNGASVVKAMKEIQEEIDAVDEEIAALEEEEVSDTIAAGVDGRVKTIYAAAGDSVTDVMYDHGALMLISADGYLSTEVKTDSLAAGDGVTVVAEDGTAYDGTVDAVWAGTASVLVSDESASVGSAVTVQKDGAEVGEGALAIHEQVSVTGYTGTVSYLSVSENEEVYAGQTLLTIEDASSTVNYATLLEERAELEDQLQNLVAVHKEGAVCAQENGMVTAVSTTEDSTTTTTSTASSSSGSGSSSGSNGSSSSNSSSSSAKTSSTTTTVTENSDKEDGLTISICPTDYMTVQFTVDETDILALEVGQSAEVTIEALSDDAYTAKITDLDTAGTSSNGVTTYTATLVLDKEDGMLDGMSASAVIIIEGKDDALLVPVEAVHKTSSTSYVYTSYDEETKEFGDMVEVVTGLSNSEYTEISSGLSEGDTVYYAESEEDERSRRNSNALGGMGSMGGMGDMGGMGGQGGQNRPSGGGDGSSRGGNGGGRPSRS